VRTAALALVLVAAGCGAAAAPAPRQPRIPRALADAWRGQADGVAAALAAHDGCLARQRAAALQRGVIDAINSRALAPRFQEPLLGAVNDLAARISCAPAPPARGHGDDEGDDGG
jgi:hypothetical protein